MRRIVWVLAAAVLALAGCGGAADEGSSDSAGEGGGPMEVRGFVCMSLKLGVLTALS